MNYQNKTIPNILVGSFVLVAATLPSIVRAENLVSPGLTTEIKSLNQVGTTTPQELFGVALGTLFTVIGAIVLLMIVVGGLMLMTARGNSEQTGKAIKTLVWAALGTLVVFSAMALTRFVVSIFF